MYRSACDSACLVVTVPIVNRQSLTCGDRAREQGLGFPQLSNMRTLPVFFNMITQQLIDAPTFAVYLNPNPAAEPAGEVQFGGMNNARFTGSMTWTPVVEKT